MITHLVVGVVLSIIKSFLAAFTGLLLVFLAIPPAHAREFQPIGTPVKSSSGFEVTVTKLELIQKSGSTQLRVDYLQENVTGKTRLDEGIWKLFFTDGTSAPQFGFFGELFPGDKKIRTFTWEWVGNKKPLLIEWEADFFQTKPSTNGLFWSPSESVNALPEKPTVDDSGPTLTSFALNPNTIQASKAASTNLSISASDPSGISSIRVTCSRDLKWAVFFDLSVGAIGRDPFVRNVLKIKNPLEVISFEGNTSSTAFSAIVKIGGVDEWEPGSYNCSIRLRDAALSGENETWIRDHSVLELTESGQSAEKPLQPEETVPAESEPEVTEEINLSDKIRIQQAGSSTVVHSVGEGGKFRLVDSAGTTLASFEFDEFEKSSFVYPMRIQGSFRLQREDDGGFVDVEAKKTRDLLWFENHNFGKVRNLSESQISKIYRLVNNFVPAINEPIDWLPRSAPLTKFICTGIYLEGASLNEKVEARKAAKEVCDAANALQTGAIDQPGASFWFQTKPTKAASFDGKVLVTVKGLENFVRDSLK